MTGIRYAAAVAATLLASTALAQAQTKVTIGTVNNADMIVMQRLSSQFAQAHPDIQLEWVVLEENVLRQRVTTDIATGGGQFDVMTIGTYEVPIWAAEGWLAPLDDLPADYDLDDVIKPVRDGLSYDGTLYALPFYAESSMLFYRSDLFEQAGIEVPEQPTWQEVRGWAEQLHDPGNEVYGICLRGKPGWGENMAFTTTLVNTFGGQWFNTDWEPQLNSEPWREAVTFYVDLLNNYGPPGASSNGFNENLALFSTGKCAMWVDATVAAGMLFNPAQSQVADKLGFAQAPIDKHPKGANWLWSWALGVPASSKSVDAAKTFVAWATSKAYIELVGASEGWVAVPPGTRASTYARAEYQEAAPFADSVLAAIKSADPIETTANPKPYSGVQYVGIPEFQALGASVGQMIAAALTGQMSVEQALDSAQRSTERTMRQAGYPK
jgi:sorbitol/mannitol transport system substrate-binding protein